MTVFGAGGACVRPAVPHLFEDELDDVYVIHVEELYHPAKPLRIKYPQPPRENYAQEAQEKGDTPAKRRKDSHEAPILYNYRPSVPRRLE